MGSVECPNCKVRIPGIFWNSHSAAGTQRLKDCLMNLGKKWFEAVNKLNHLECAEHISSITTYLEEVVSLLELSGAESQVPVTDRACSPLRFLDRSTMPSATPQSTTEWKPPEQAFVMMTGGDHLSHSHQPSEDIPPPCRPGTPAPTVAVDLNSSFSTASDFPRNTRKRMNSLSETIQVAPRYTNHRPASPFSVEGIPQEMYQFHPEAPFKPADLTTEDAGWTGFEQTQQQKFAAGQPGSGRLVGVKVVAPEEEEWSEDNCVSFDTHRVMRQGEPQAKKARNEPAVAKKGRFMKPKEADKSAKWVRPYNGRVVQKVTDIPGPFRNLMPKGVPWTPAMVRHIARKTCRWGQELSFMEYERNRKTIQMFTAHFNQSGAFRHQLHIEAIKDAKKASKLRAKLKAKETMIGDGGMMEVTKVEVDTDAHSSSVNDGDESLNT